MKMVAQNNDNPKILAAECAKICSAEKSGWNWMKYLGKAQLNKLTTAAVPPNLENGEFREKGLYNIIL